MYFGGFNSRDDITEEFRIEQGCLDDVIIHIACYCCEDYSGSAFVLYEEKGVLFEVNGSHCSCYGLEDQWSPEETSWLDMYHRCTKGNLGIHGSQAESFNSSLLELIRSRWSVS